MVLCRDPLVGMSGAVGVGVRLDFRLGGGFANVDGLKLIKGGVKLLGILQIGGLLALHGKDGNLVEKGELLRVGSCVFFSFVQLDALGEEVLRDSVLDVLGVLFLVVDPACELVGIFSCVLGELIDLVHGLFNGFLVLVHGDEDVVVCVDAARNLAMGGGEWSSRYG